MFREERRLLSMIAAVNGALLDCVLATLFLDLPPLLQLLMLGIALIGQMSAFYLLALFHEQRRLYAARNNAGHFRFQRYPQTTHREPLSRLTTTTVESKR